MKTVSETLLAARDLLVTKGWTQGTFARTAESHTVAGRHSGAVCYCGWGALEAVTRELFSPEFNAADRALMAAGGFAHFPTFNDAAGRTLDDVLAVFDKAIAAQEAPLDPQ